MNLRLSQSCTEHFNSWLAEAGVRLALHFLARCGGWSIQPLPVACLGLSASCCDLVPPTATPFFTSLMLCKVCKCMTSTLSRVEESSFLSKAGPQASLRFLEATHRLKFPLTLSTVKRNTTCIHALMNPRRNSCCIQYTSTTY